MLNLIQKIKSIFTKKKKVFEWKPIYRFLYKSYIPNSDNSAKLVIRNAYIRNNKDLVNTKIPIIIHADLHATYQRFQDLINIIYSNICKYHKKEIVEVYIHRFSITNYVQYHDNESVCTMPRLYIIFDYSLYINKVIVDSYKLDIVSTLLPESSNTYKFDIFFSNNLTGDTTTLPQFNIVDESISEFLDDITINLNPNTNEFYLDDKNNSNMINMFFGNNKNVCQYINLNCILEHSKVGTNQKQNFYNIPKNIKWKKYYYTFL